MLQFLQSIDENTLGCIMAVTALVGSVCLGVKLIAMLVECFNEN